MVFVMYTATRMRRCQKRQAALDTFTVEVQSGRAPIGVGRVEVKLVQPEVGRVLDALEHGQRLVVRTLVLVEGCVIEDGGPEQGTAFSRSDCEAAVKLGTAALLDIREVEEEGVHSRARLHPHHLWDEVVVAPVELALSMGLVCLRARHVTQKLYELRVVEGHLRHIGHPRDDPLYDGIVDARLIAPAVPRRPDLGGHRNELVVFPSSRCHRSLVPALSVGKQNLHLLVLEETIEDGDAWVGGEKLGLELGEVAHRAFEHVANRAWRDAAVVRSGSGQFLAKSSIRHVSQVAAHLLDMYGLFVSQKPLACQASQLEGLSLSTHGFGHPHEARQCHDMNTAFLSHWPCSAQPRHSVANSRSSSHAGGQAHASRHAVCMKWRLASHSPT
eukprot:CAMPEP_0183362606 /NCGR_PEP_ID=MMETSP0164_2-20130417/70427_1 /TAXON_ID=221442 /ORGANISM="Coccolithus pelagicus ssp braarudi, Strain PLY182g" /LENGTH=386 /DNA_ID=CAMNT_0025537507 /DNA_START=250 /DNA_END=1406 /DNA_ORIENTATION=+